MKSIKLYHRIVTTLLILITFWGINSCLKEDDIPLFSFSRDYPAEILTYLESQGDYFNSNDCPSLISAGALYENLSGYLILDIRSSKEYTKGHISGAVSLKKNELISYLRNKNIDFAKNIVLISATGQSASYCAAGLKIIGYLNVYALKYGMASWNIEFANTWLSAIDGKMDINLNNISYSKPAFTGFPVLSFNNPQLTIQEKIEQQVTKGLSEDFTDEVEESLLSSKINLFLSDGKFINSFGNYFTVCSGPFSLYYQSPVKDETIPSHPPNSIFFQHQYPIFDLSSSAYLQTLPLNNPILIYSTDGHLSAELTMYLKVLGYDVRSQLFGCNYFLYSKARMNGYGFSTSSINNYPYEK